MKKHMVHAFVPSIVAPSRGCPALRSHTQTFAHQHDKLRLTRFSIIEAGSGVGYCIAHAYHSTAEVGACIIL